MTNSPWVSLQNRAREVPDHPVWLHGQPFAANSSTNYRAVNAWQSDGVRCSSPGSVSVRPCGRCGSSERARQHNVALRSADGSIRMATTRSVPLDVERK
jgi:hypothetical protein